MSNRVASKLVLLAAAVLLGGCYDCAQDRDVQMLMFEAQKLYQSKKFELSASLYITVLNRCNDYYDAIIGLANAWREHGNDLFRGAEDLSKGKRPDDARKMAQDANKFHIDSERYLRTALRHRPDDLLPHYGLGLLWYQRATSPVSYPYALSDTKNRQRERDLAISEFTLVTSKVSQLYEAHRYLGLALFAAGRMGEGIDHLSRFHDSRQIAYNSILRENPQNETDKEEKAKRLNHVEREIEEVRQVLMLRHEDLVKDHDRLTGKGESNLNAEEKQELARCSREMLAIESIVRKFQLVQLDPEQEELRRRSRDYLEAFNRGLSADVLAYVSAPPGGQAVLERAILAKLEEGTKYTRVFFQSIAVSGTAGTVGFACDLVTRKETRKNVEVVLRWRRAEGQWMVSEHP